MGLYGLDHDLDNRGTLSLNIMTLTVTVTVTLTVTVTATEGAEPHMEYLMDMEVINQIHFEIFNLNKFYIQLYIH